MRSNTSEDRRPHRTINYKQILHITENTPRRHYRSDNPLKPLMEIMAVHRANYTKHIITLRW